MAQGAEYIKQKILNDAKTAADASVAEAKKTAAAKLSAIKKQIEQDEIAATEKARAAMQAQLQNSKDIAKLDTQKQMLAERQTIADQCFELAREELLQKKSLISKLIKKHSKPGDKITPCDGGAIISNNNYELRITADELLNSMRSQIEPQLLEILFTPEG